jgi:multisubunit Na+/H+ antiporter MnhF subunit
MQAILQQHKQPKSLLINLGFFLTFLLIYVLLDINGNESYANLLALEGMTTLVLHILFTILLSVASSVVMTWSYLSIQLFKKDNVVTNIPFLGVAIGFLTFGCTPCVVAFLSIFGITFVPLILPMANLLFKVLTLILIVISGALTWYFVNKGCEVTPSPSNS